MTRHDQPHDALSLLALSAADYSVFYCDKSLGIKGGTQILGAKLDQYPTTVRAAYGSDVIDTAAQKLRYFHPVVSGEFLDIQLTLRTARGEVVIHNGSFEYNARGTIRVFGDLIHRSISIKRDAGSSIGLQEFFRRSGQSFDQNRFDKISANRPAIRESCELMRLKPFRHVSAEMKAELIEIRRMFHQTRLLTQLYPHTST